VAFSHKSSNATRKIETVPLNGWILPDYHQCVVLSFAKNSAPVVPGLDIEEKQSDRCDP
jgi:hypothetical protein